MKVCNSLIMLLFFFSCGKLQSKARFLNETTAQECDITQGYIKKKTFQDLFW